MVALTPCLMLAGYTSLVVPAGVALIWGFFYYATGSAWPRTEFNWCIAALLVLAAASLVMSNGVLSDLRVALPKITALVLGIAWFFAIVRWHGAGFTLQSIIWVLVVACFSLTVVGAVTIDWQTKFPGLSTVTSRLPRVSLGSAGVISFTQVYLHPANDTEPLESIRAITRARSVLDELRQKPDTDPVAISDPFLRPPEFRDISERQVARLFGPDFATRVVALPLGEWRGPFTSPFGLHLVRLDALHPGQPPESAENGVHPNAIAGTLLLLIPLCIAPLSRYWGNQRGLEDRGRQRLESIGMQTQLRQVSSGAVLILAFVLLLLTQSRAGWLGALTAGLALVLFRVRRFQTWPATPIVVAFGLGCAAVVFWAVIPNVSLLGGDLSSTWAARLEIWRLGFLVIGDFPWTGVGFNGFRHLAPILSRSSYQWYGMDLAHPHNMWLSVAVDLGIPGLIAYLVLWVMVINRLLRVVTSGRIMDALVAQCLLAGWVGFWVFGIADAIPLGTKLGTVLWPTLALSALLQKPDLRPAARAVGSSRLVSPH